MGTVPVLCSAAAATRRGLGCSLLQELGFRSLGFRGFEVWALGARRLGFKVY